MVGFSVISVGTNNSNVIVNAFTHRVWAFLFELGVQSPTLASEDHKKGSHPFCVSICQMIA